MLSFKLRTFAKFTMILAQERTSYVKLGSLKNATDVCVAMDSSLKTTYVQVICRSQVQKGTRHILCINDGLRATLIVHYTLAIVSIRVNTLSDTNLVGCTSGWHASIKNAFAKDISVQGLSYFTSGYFWLL